MNDQQALAEFYQLRPELDIRANDSFLIEKAAPVSIHSLSVAAIQLEDKLLIAPAYESAWQAFVLYNPEKKGTAFRREFFEKMRDKEIQAAKKHEYDSLIKELGREDLRGTPLQDLREIVVKPRLIERILQLIASSNNGRDGKFDEFNLKSERLRMASWTIPALTARLEEVVRKQTLSAKPIGELQQIVQSGRRYVGFPQLGKTIVRPGTVRAIPLDAAYLRGFDAWELKKFCRLYGTIQVNDRLAGKD